MIEPIDTSINIDSIWIYRTENDTMPSVDSVIIFQVIDSTVIKTRLY